MVKNMPKKTKLFPEPNLQKVQSQSNAFEIGKKLYEHEVNYSKQVPKEHYIEEAAKTNCKYFYANPQLDQLKKSCIFGVEQKKKEIKP